MATSSLTVSNVLNLLKATVTGVAVVNGEVRYQIQLALSNAREENIKETQLRTMRKAKRKPNKGEGIYHWEGMTDDEDEEWNPAGRGTRSAEGNNVEKDRLHFGHFEQLVLLFMKYVRT